MTGRPVIVIALSWCLLVLAAAGAHAQNARYTMLPIEGGALRLDTHSGAVALCSRKDGYWLCEALPEERDALRREIDRLTDETAALRAELEAARKQLAEKDEAERRGLRLPTDQDVEQMMAYFEKMMRRFQHMIESLKQRQAPRERL